MSKKHKRREAEARSFEPQNVEAAQAPRSIDLSEPDALERWARYFGTTPEEIALAVETVGTNRTAVELFLTAPAPETSASLQPRAV